MRVSTSPSDEKLVSDTKGKSGQTEIPWIVDSTIYDFRLYGNSQPEAPLDSVLVRRAIHSAPMALRHLADEALRGNIDMAEVSRFIAAVIPACLQGANFPVSFRVWERHGFHVTPVPFVAPSLVSERPRPSLSTLSLTYAYSHAHYQEIAAQFQKLGEYQRRQKIQESLLTGANEFSVPGYCHITSRYTEFTVDLRKVDQVKLPNWRESLFSEGIYNSRMRASMHIFEEILRPRKQDPIYITEYYAPLYAWLKKKYPNTIGSEYLGPGIAPGSVDEHGVRNESLSALSFPDESMQFVLSFECFEHFADYKAGLRECARVLKPGGSLLMTVPFRLDSAQNIVRARDREDGTVEHLLPPEYHGDPVRKEGCLCYYHFGWELLDDMWAAGFRNPRACLYWSREFGYLGIEQVLFMANK